MTEQEIFWRRVYVGWCGTLSYPLTLMSMNMYTRPEYRRKGIAFHTLDLLVQDAREKGINSVSLEATAAGRPLYERYGFSGMKDEMELIL